LEDKFTKKVEDDRTFKIAYDFVRKEKTRLTEAHKSRLCKKFDSLMTKQRPKCERSGGKEDWLINLTSVTIPTEVNKILQLGPKFSHRPSKIPFEKIVTDVEYVIHQTRTADEVKTEVRQRIALLLNKIKSSGLKKTNTPTDTYITTGERRTVEKFLEDNENLVITRADKGNATVILEKKEYDRKLHALLEDTSTYKKVNVDPTLTIQRKNNDIVKRMFENKYIEVALKKSLTTYNSVAPRIYGLPKVHKQDAPLRPIVSFIKAPMYNLSKFLANILTCVSEDDINIRNSYDLVDRLSKIKLNPNDVLVSFDVVSLFTNVPVSLAIEVIDQRWNHISNYTSLSKDMFFEALKFCLTNGYCKYDNVYYAQVEGVAMGSPLSPIVAEIVLDNLFRTINEKNEVRFIVKYVDDSLCIINKNYVNDILVYMNNYHNRLQFTCEHEKDGSINFLDVTIFRTCNLDLKFRHYKKPTYTGRIINYNSNQPDYVKKNTAKCLLNSWLRLSDSSFHYDIKNEFRNVMTKNDYPSHYINSILFDKHSAKAPPPREPEICSPPLQNVINDDDNVNNDNSISCNIDHNVTNHPPPFK
jgi:hypothetical protein